MGDESQVRFPLPMFQAGPAMEQMEKHLANWSRANTQLAQGLMQAALTQLELARTISVGTPEQWTRCLQSGGSQAAAQDMLEMTRARFETTMRTYRRINDQMAECFFTAAETMIEGMGNAPAWPPEPAPAARRKA